MCHGLCWKEHTYVLSSSALFITLSVYLIFPLLTFSLTFLLSVQDSWQHPSVHQKCSCPLQWKTERRGMILTYDCMLYPVYLLLMVNFIILGLMFSRKKWHSVWSFQVWQSWGKLLLGILPHLDSCFCCLIYMFNLFFWCCTHSLLH